jgi:hypothetical protein
MVKAGEIDFEQNVYILDFDGSVNANFRTISTATGIKAASFIGADLS